MISGNKDDIYVNCTERRAYKHNGTDWVDLNLTHDAFEELMRLNFMSSTYWMCMRPEPITVTDIQECINAWHSQPHARTETCPSCNKPGTEKNMFKHYKPGCCR